MVVRITERFSDLQIKADLLALMRTLIEKFNLESDPLRLLAHRALRAVDAQLKGKAVI